MDALKGFLKQTGQEFLDAAGTAFTDAAKDVVGNVINEMFIKKEAETKRFLPSIKNMRVVSIFALRLAWLVVCLYGVNCGNLNK